MATTQITNTINNRIESKSYVSFSKLKAPYLKEAKKVKGFHIWYVDGSYVRKNIDTEFNNYGQHYRFNFIPKKEFWIDYEAKKELKYFIDHLLIEFKLMDHGKDYFSAVTIADKIEKKERLENPSIKSILKYDKEEVIDLIHKKILFKTDKLKVWVVSGYLVRSLFNPSFTAGGHDRIYNFIPKNEVWIDNTIASKDWGFVILHELYERNLMLNNHNLSKKDNYEDSHEKAIKLEKKFMASPDGLDERIKIELNKITFKKQKIEKLPIEKYLQIARNSRKELKTDKIKFWENNKSKIKNNIEEIIKQFRFPKNWKINVAISNFLDKKDNNYDANDTGTWSFVDIVGATKKQGFDIFVFFHKSDLEFLSLPALIPIVVHEMKHVEQAIRNPKQYIAQAINDDLHKKHEAEAEAEIGKYPEDFRKQAVLEKIVYSYYNFGWKSAKKTARYLYIESKFAFGDGYVSEMNKEEYDLFLKAEKAMDIDLFINNFSKTFENQ
ncbi:MAG: hypothetical protein WC867_04340 [Candidatus Pacearchaeota archaeon]|jgi:hypothetical protein